MGYAFRFRQMPGRRLRRHPWSVYFGQEETLKGIVMHVTIVYVHVKPQHVADFLAATRLNHEASVNEDGNRRFDVLQSKDDATKFVLYEAYASAEEAARHKQTRHYTVWRETVADWMASPREGVSYDGLFPAG